VFSVYVIYASLAELKWSDIPKDDLDFQVTNPAGRVAVRTIVEAC